MRYNNRLLCINVLGSFIYRVSYYKSCSWNISSAKYFQKKCFRQKSFGSKGDIRGYYWFDLEWRH